MVVRIARIFLVLLVPLHSLLIYILLVIVNINYLWATSVACVYNHVYCPAQFNNHVDGNGNCM